MGQIYSSEYSCETNGSGDDCSKRGRGIEDVGDSELNTSGPGALSSSSASSTGKQGPNWQVRASDEERQQHVRKLSNVSHRNIQLLSMKPRSEKDVYADDLRTRRRSSLINLILGAPSSGPRFCDDLCSLSSHISEVYFGIESFSEPRFGCGSTSTLRLASIEDTERADPKFRPSATAGVTQNSQKLPHGRRSSFGSLATISDDPIGKHDSSKTNVPVAPSSQQDRRLSRAKSRNPSLASTLASIDLTSSFEQHGDKLSRNSQIPLPIAKQIQKPPLVKSRQLENDIPASGEFANDIRTRVSRSRINQTARIIRRTGSELSLYSTISASSIGSGSHASSTGTPESITQSLRRETKLIILLQVALPFILAGFGNMAAGLVLESVSRKRAFSSAPILFVLLPSLVGLKGNIEMTLASRFSTLSNLNLLDTSQRRIRAYASNLTLVVSQAIGLSLFAAAMSIICELSIFGAASSGALANLSLGGTTLAVSASALTTSVALVILSSIVVSSAVALANLIQVNPDNLSTLIAALYGDVSCVFVYGLVAERMFDLVERNLLTWPLVVVIATLVLWPISLYLSYKFKETHSVALYSMPPMIISILISMGSGSLLSLFVGRFKLIALYQPVVNGFGANLVAVQASRVTTWLWCSALSKLPTGDRGLNKLPSKMIGSLASFDAPKPLERKSDNRGGLLLVKSLKMIGKSVRLFLWSFCNSSPNAIAARLLLIMLIPAHTIYFFVIWLISAASHVVITWQFYTVYIGLCLVQVFILLVICEPFMTLLMNRNMDPDVFGISILMAVADLTGTICLTLAFFLLSSIGDVNAMQ